MFSSTIALTGATKDKPGTVGAPVRVGGVRVAAGDWVVADVDGVTFVPGGALADVLAAGRARETKEAGFFEALRGGSTTVELLGLDAVARAGGRGLGARGRSGTQVPIAARTAANAPGAVTGRRWPESIRTTSAGGGSRPAISSWVPGGTAVSARSARR